MLIGICPNKDFPEEIRRVEKECENGQDKRHPRIGYEKRGWRSVSDSASEEVVQLKRALRVAHGVHVVHFDWRCRHALFQTHYSGAESARHYERGADQEQYDGRRAVELVHAVVGELLLSRADFCERR